MTPAAIIAQQLGGKRFLVMTGATFINSGNNNRLQVNFPSSKGFNRFFVELKSDDTYTVEFGYYRAMKYKEKEVLDGVYAEQLQEIFTDRTGLYTHL